MLDISFDYGSCVSASEKVSWKIDDVMPPGTALDFTRPFLPAALAGSELPFLDAAERLKLNQINGNAYLNLFGFVEEYILATVLQHAQAESFGDHDAIRALARFADEEAKHQALFQRYVAAFERDCGFQTEVLGSAAEVANIILSKSPLAVMLVTLHLEIMTQAHYVECVRDDTQVDPFFAKLLHAHWLEESQHARIDALELNRMLEVSGPAQIQVAFDDYLELIGAFDGLLRAQAEMDARTLAGALGRTFTPDQVAALEDAQHAGYRRTFLIYGMTHQTFVQHLEAISPDGAARVRVRADELG